MKCLNFFIISVKKLFNNKSAVTVNYSSTLNVFHHNLMISKLNKLNHEQR